jgi:catechol 2,3-dioxygenase-like lactoylglutathione lyase family enzyme
MIRQLAHLCFHTDHTDQMVAFYRDALGLPIKFTLTGDDGLTLGYYFECGQSTFIEIFDQARAIQQWGGQRQPLAPGNRYQHFCLEITGLDAFKAALEGRGLKVSPVTMGMDGSRQAWIADPDGNAIELMEYTPESLQLRRPA